MSGERQWLEWLGAAARRGAGNAAMRLGMGDDAALLRPRAGWELALTTDLMLENVHFRRGPDTAAEVGRRLATRALSDLAAMGAEPLCLLVSCAFPSFLLENWGRACLRGVVAAGRAAGATLAGGDLAAAPNEVIVLDVVGVGQVRAGRALRRSGARVGDHLYVSGRLGLAARGRRLLHAGRTPHSAFDREAAAWYRHPCARTELGRALVGVASAALDISDGLSTDLHHLCRASGVGAIVETDRIPALPGAENIELALHGGEDYELLFAAPPEHRARVNRLARRFPIAAIGEITSGRRLFLRAADGRRTALANRGWQHFQDPQDPSGAGGEAGVARGHAKADMV